MKLRVQIGLIVAASAGLWVSDVTAQSSGNACNSRLNQGGWVIEVDHRRGVDALGGDEIGYVRSQPRINSLGGDEIGYIRASISRSLPRGGGSIQIVRWLPTSGATDSDWRFYVVGEDQAGSNRRYAITSASGRREIVSQDREGLPLSQAMRQELLEQPLTLQRGFASQGTSFTAEGRQAPIRVDGLARAHGVAEAAQARALDAARAGQCSGQGR